MMTVMMMMIMMMTDFNGDIKLFRQRKTDNIIKLAIMCWLFVVVLSNLIMGILCVALWPFLTELF